MSAMYYATYSPDFEKIWLFETKDMLFHSAVTAGFMDIEELGPSIVMDIDKFTTMPPECFLVLSESYAYVKF